MTPKERHYRLLVRRGVPEHHARRLATGLFIGIGLVTNTAFVAGRDDGFGKDNRARRIAYANARALGINPSGKIYSPQLARPGMGMGKDPEAWLDPADARDSVKRICQQRGIGCDDLGVKGREPTHDPLAGPYKVDERIVQEQVERIEEEAGEPIVGKEREDLVEKTAKRLAGRQ